MDSVSTLYPRNIKKYKSLTMSSDNEFEQGDAGSNLTYPKAGGSVRKGSYIMLKGFPCQVEDISISKTGKHGHAKARCTGKDIFTDKKYVDVFPTSHNVDCPFVKKQDYEMVDCEADENNNANGTVSYMDEEGEVKEIFIAENEELVGELVQLTEDDKNVMINVIIAMDKEMITGFRETRAD